MLRHYIIIIDKFEITVLLKTIEQGQQKPNIEKNLKRLKAKVLFRT